VRPSLVFRERLRYFAGFFSDPRDLKPYLVFRVPDHDTAQTRQKVRAWSAEFFLRKAPRQPRQRWWRARRLDRLRGAERRTSLRSPLDEIARMRASPRGLASPTTRLLALVAATDFLPITDSWIWIEAAMTNRATTPSRRRHPRDVFSFLLE
jgi:hypothetical protein